MAQAPTLNPGHVSVAHLSPSWPVVKAGVQHPDHPDVTGDLVRSLSGQYYIRTDKGECRSVPHAWACDVKDEVIAR